MEDVTLIRTGGLSGDGSDLPVQVEFYNPNRRSFTKPVEGAKQMKTFLT